MLKMTTSEYERTDSGKSWASKPVKVEVKEVTEEQVRLITNDDTLKFFRRLGGFERVDYGYTSKGYKPIECLSISPNKQIKKVRSFNWETE